MLSNAVGSEGTATFILILINVIKIHLNSLAGYAEFQSEQFHKLCNVHKTQVVLFSLLCFRQTIKEAKEKNLNLFRIFRIEIQLRSILV